MKVHKNPHNFECLIKKSFSRHAKNYDRHAHLQKLMAEKLAFMLPEKNVDMAMELGCGTGVFTRHLLSLPIRKLFLNDVSPGMIEQLKVNFSLPNTISIITGNAERIRFPRTNLIAANAVFQWFQDPGRMLNRLCKSLKPGGYLVFNSFGPQTLKEFREIADIEGPVYLRSVEDWESLLKEAGFTRVRSHLDIHTMFLENSLSLLKNLQQLGAAPIPMINPGGLRKILKKYDTQFSSGQGVSSTWELQYFVFKI